jgi:hypothetical protein
MLVTTTNFDGDPVTMDLPVTKEQISRWQAGERIQDVMPEISSSQRKFILTGMTYKEQDEFYAQFEEE